MELDTPRENVEEDIDVIDEELFEVLALLLVLLDFVLLASSEEVLDGTQLIPVALLPPLIVAHDLHSALGDGAYHAGDTPGVHSREIGIARHLVVRVINSREGRELG